MSLGGLEADAASLNAALEEARIPLEHDLAVLGLRSNAQTSLREAVRLLSAPLRRLYEAADLPFEEAEREVEAAAQALVASALWHVSVVQTEAARPLTLAEQRDLEAQIEREWALDRPEP